MKIVFVKRNEIHLDLELMARRLLSKRFNCSTFETFFEMMLEYTYHTISPEFYDNWMEIKNSVYNNLFIYCCENDLMEELEHLKKLKDF